MDRDWNLESLTYDEIDRVSDITLIRQDMSVNSYRLFLRINVTEKNFSHMVNRTHDLGTNRLAHRSRTLYHYTKSNHFCSP